jgi:secernin
MCDCLVALAPATRAGATIFAKNSDRPPGEAQPLEQHPPRRDTSRVRCTYVEVEPAGGETLGLVGSRPWWCWGFEHGVNTAGVAIGNEAVYTTLDPRSVPPALLGMDLVRLGLERGRSAAAAVSVMIDLLERHGQGGSGHHGVDRPYWSSFLVADGGDAWVLETSGRTWATEQVTRARAVSNRTTIPDFDAATATPASRWRQWWSPA